MANMRDDRPFEPQPDEPWQDPEIAKQNRLRNQNAILGRGRHAVERMIAAAQLGQDGRILPAPIDPYDKPPTSSQGRHVAHPDRFK